MSEQNNSNNALQTLQGLLNQRTQVIGQWYSNARVSLDGYHFTKCRFDNCQLLSNTGDFQMINCYIAEDNVIYIPSSAVRPIRLLLHRQQRLGKGIEDLPAFRLFVKNDGTVNI